jgi:alkane 1-monooxygenase
MIYSRYLFASIPSILCIFGNLTGGFSTSLNIFYSMLLLPVAEWFVPDSAHNEEKPLESYLPTLILIFLSLLHLLVSISLIYGIYNHTINGVYIFIAAIASGINAGTNGIVVAHELIHRKGIGLRVLGIFNLVQVNYGHFYIEHIKGHHKYVGTEADPATAFYGESLYHFIRRTIPGQFLSAFQIEKKRLYDQGKSQIRSFVVLVTSFQITLIILIYLGFGLKILMAYLIYGIMAILLLEYVNYIEHYGLHREDGKKFEAHHAWQSNKISSRLGLIELSRHSDHHLKASKPYHTLDSHPGYFLPAGYFGMFYMALIPSLWFKKINPIIDAEKNKFN